MAQLKDLLVEGKSRFIDKIYASDQFISKVVQGTSPFLIDSSTLVSNLNADLLDGFHAFGTDNIANNRYLLKQSKFDIGATSEEAYYRIATLSNGVSSNNRDALFYTIDIIFNRYWLYRVRHRGVSDSDREYTIAVVATNASASDLRIYYGAYNASAEIFVKQVASSVTVKTILTKVFVEGQRGSSLSNYIQLDTTPVTTFTYTNYHSGTMSIYIPWDNITGKPGAATSYGYIGTTAVQATSAAGQDLTGIGTIYIKGNGNNWTEGIRIKPNGSWATILLGGSDLTADTGTSANSWSLHNYNGSFYLAKNGSGASGTNTAVFQNVSNNWNFAKGTLTSSNQFTAAARVIFSGLDTGSSDVTDGTEILTSYASNNGFADSNGLGIVYKRQASKLYNYIKSKTDLIYAKYSDILDVSTNPSANLDLNTRMFSTKFTSTSWDYAHATYILNQQAGSSVSSAGTVFSFPGSYPFQIQRDYNSNNYYLRGYYSNTGWQPWVRIALSGESYTKAESDALYLPLAGGWMNWNAQIYFKGLNNSTSVYSKIGYATSASGQTMHCVNTAGNQANGAFYITSNGSTSANDTGGLAIDNEGVTVFGAGDAGSNFTGIFRVLNEDNVADGPQFIVTKASGATTKYSHTAQKFISTVATGTQPYSCTSTTLNTNLNTDLLDGEHAAAFAHRQTYNNMVHSGNEYTWIAPGYTGGIWINYRTASGATDGSINEYIFGTGKGTQLAKISLNTFHGNITGNAATATSATTATTATRLGQNTEMTYGWSGINYFNISAANQSVAKVNDTPYSSATWTHILRFNHANNGGYYTDLAVPFNANSLYYKRVNSGTLQNSTTNGGWIRVLDALNYTDYIGDALFRLRRLNEVFEHSSYVTGMFPPALFELKSAGYPVYTDPEFASGTNSVNVYNNSGGGTVTITREQAGDHANSSGYQLKIVTNGTASPGAGGFYQTISSRANAVFVQIFRAKVPVGYNVTTASNSMGASYQDKFITSRAGTGKWEWYARVVYCGASGTFSSGGHVYLSATSGYSATSVTWYLSYCNLIDITKLNYDGLRTRYADSATDATYMPLITSSTANYADSAMGKKMAFNVYALTGSAPTPVSGTGPSTGDGFFMVFNYNDAYVTQIAVDLDPTYKLSVRHWKNDASTWRPWRDILTTANYTSYLGYIGTTAVQASSAAQAVTGITALTFNGATSAGTNYITGTAGRIYFGGNFHLDSLGSNATYINYYTGNNVYLVSGSTQGKVGIGTSSPENKLDVNGIASIYQRGNDNTAFKGLLILKQQNSSEGTNDTWSATQPSFGIQFNRFWTSGSSPYGETACAGIFALVTASWKGGLVFRTKNNTTQGGTHDISALILKPSGAAEFASTVTASRFISTVATGTQPYACTSTTLNTNLNADLLDGYHAGVNNGNVGVFVPWPSATTMKNEGLMPSEYGTSEYGYPDNVYLQSICKWAIAHYVNLGDVTLIGSISPNSSGTCILHLYSSSGKDSSTLLPRYCSGVYTTLTGYNYNFGTYNYTWYYRQVSANGHTHSEYSLTSHNHDNRYSINYNYSGGPINSGSSSVTVNNLAAAGATATGMIYASTDNPTGASKWVHVWSQAWAAGVNTSWVSQIALGVSDSTGMWYRTRQGTIVGAAWTRVIDSTNIGSQSVAYATVASKISDITTSDAASSTATWRRVWFSYNDNVTGRPAYSDNFAYQTSTGTLKVGKLSITGSTGYSWLGGQQDGPITLNNATNTGSYWSWIRQTNTSSSKYFSIGVLNTSLYIIGSASSRTDNGYDYGWRFDVNNGWAYGNFQNADTVDGEHASAFARKIVAGTTVAMANSGGTITVETNKIIPVTTTNTSAVTFNFTWNSPAACDEAHVIITGSGSSKTITIGNVNSDSTNTKKNNTAIKVTSGGYGEISILYFDSKYFIRAVGN